MRRSSRPFISSLIPVLIAACLLGSCGDRNRPGNGGDTTAVDTSSTPSGDLCTIPTSVPTGLGYGEGGALTPAGQKPFDDFSWQSFIALNCPAPVPGYQLKGSYDNVPKVWETYADAFELFRPEENTTLRTLAGDPNDDANKVLRLMAKNQHIDFDDPKYEFLEATQLPLIDKNMNYVLYELRVNPIEEEYIRRNGLNTYNGQKNFFDSGKTVLFPPGPDDVEKTVGSMEIKAAWRILDTAKGDDPSRYYTRRTSIFIDAQHTVDGKPLLVQNVLVGLIAMHIVHKTQKEQEWIWSTFEHVDNAPGPYDSYSDPWSLFNGECQTCPENGAPSKGTDSVFLWMSTQPYAARYATTVGDRKYGTQAVRIADIFPETQERNAEWRAKVGVKGTPAENYRLLGTQWSAFGFRFPKVLANPALETYDQGNSSCISCHSFATTAYGNRPADFSFLLGLPKKSAQ